MRTLQPGENAPKTGNYKVVKNGKTMNTVHVEQGKTMPPTPDSKCHYEIG